MFVTAVDRNGKIRLTKFDVNSHKNKSIELLYTWMKIMIMKKWFP